ncbi:Formate hydrogenase, subunit F [Leptospira biflexa serovar Patoc strain 'Patoc 1 (Ames)']|uniref:Hydrogenase-4 subunit F n=1 Tax=Leptospira biflexa serovar Patoc (strain Patoc 1 / ATCC 23582 / Paris) TaxID=456481 RepID=B0SL16_LEPBP|nr:proton-conducting transporter membrane subunit [Leptospira biflexa]ABZ94840.1 Formate hydrogenase, subunit F [Leptospira biflexa serovar Patoc strain 'Patoc 1 (Ames)']ABZ98509.1 Hydrogenase-4 subunit F [Leptospira biflexa serovar Patoc strain 'Patoc 1 (Paris)']
MMTYVFYFSGILTFVIIFLVSVLAPTKGQTRIWLWSLLKVCFFAVLFYSWFTENIVLKWILIEASTLFGALLISSSGTERSFHVGWKFLLINSYALGLAFLGIVILLFASTPLENLDFNSLKQGLVGQSGLLVETGILLTIYGYSGKLGLVPNHFWVGDTYAESPSQISSLIASFVPVSVVLAIRPLVKLERELNPHLINASNGLLFIGVLTILYAILMLVSRDDIRRISAKVALFHTGMLTLFLWLDVSDEVFYFLLSSTVLVKLLVFLSMGILRMDAGKRNISQILSGPNLSHKALYVYLMALLIAFVFPLSPVFVLDLKIIEISVLNRQFYLFIFPILGSIFFFVALNKVLPMVKLSNRNFEKDIYHILQFRFYFFWFSLVSTIIVGSYGMYYLMAKYI